MSQLTVFPIRTIDGLVAANQIMNQLSTYILLSAVVVSQLFSTTALQMMRCADRGCQCSVEEKSSGNCCCSGESTNEDKSCCAEKRAASCCDGKRGSQLETKNSSTVCQCGCDDTSQPVPAQSNSSLDELVRSLSEALSTKSIASISGTRTFTPAPQSRIFYDGVSAQPLYCCWVI